MTPQTLLQMKLLIALGMNANAAQCVADSFAELVKENDKLRRDLRDALADAERLRAGAAQQGEGKQ